MSAYCKRKKIFKKSSKKKLIVGFLAKYFSTLEPRVLIFTKANTNSYVQEYHMRITRSGSWNSAATGHTGGELMVPRGNLSHPRLFP